jgi:hypothetical protein
VTKDLRRDNSSVGHATPERGERRWPLVQGETLDSVLPFELDPDGAGGAEYHPRSRNFDSAAVQDRR